MPKENLKLNPDMRKRGWSACLLSGLAFLLVPLLAVQDSRADESGGTGGGPGWGASGQMLKAPKNTGGLIINLPNSSKSRKVEQTTVDLIGETMGLALARHVAGNLAFNLTQDGVQVTNEEKDGKGGLITRTEDGASSVMVLLENQHFGGGAVAEITTIPVQSQGSKRYSKQQPVTSYYLMTSNVMGLDVPAILGAGKSGSFDRIQIRFFTIVGQQQASLALALDQQAGQVLVEF
jgi:hypothetical protein